MDMKFTIGVVKIQYLKKYRTVILYSYDTAYFLIFFNKLLKMQQELGNVL